jgi:predicted Fe-Mo cluster-binding NifX family protein
MLIAVATKDGREIDQHFGHAERFLIYDVEGGKAKLVDEKKIERYCSFDEGHPLRGHILRAIAEALAGCRAVVTARIGPAPQEEMERLGFNVYTTTGEIKSTVVELAKLL